MFSLYLKIFSIFTVWTILGNLWSSTIWKWQDLYQQACKKKARVMTLTRLLDPSLQVLSFKPPSTKPLSSLSGCHCCGCSALHHSLQTGHSWQWWRLTELGKCQQTCVCLCNTKQCWYQPLTIRRKWKFFVDSFLVINIGFCTSYE